jgi:putative transposase
MSAHQAFHHISTMARVLGVSRSGFYEAADRPLSARAREDLLLTQRIRAIHEMSRGTYGSPRVHAQLQADGVCVGRKRVERLMKAAGLRGVTRRRFEGTTERDARQRPAPDLVQRDFTAEAPNRLWFADVTYVPCWSGWFYLAVVIDAFSRRVVGWSMASHKRSELVQEALGMAVKARQASDVIHHSDQGSEYTSIAFGQRCIDAGIRPSMGSVGDAYDNAMAESFFATLETELFQRTVFETHAHARMAIFEFIESWYNPRRLHSSLDYVSPVQYEDRAAVALSNR